MKISIGTKIKDGPWGGGNLFAINLKNYLEKNNHEVVYNLEDDDIDLILLTEPRRTSESSSFTHIDILKYRQFVKSDVIVVHRINECDERKKTNFVNQYLIEANKSADATVFVSSWLKDLFMKQGLECEKISVILSGSSKIKVLNFGKEIVNSFQFNENISIMGPVEAPISLLRGKYRYRILFKSSERRRLNLYVGKWLKNIVSPSNIKLSIDVDPYSFL